MNKRAIQLIPSIVLYVFAGLLMIYAIWSYSYCADIIAQAIAAGQLAASGSEHDIASFYMANCGQYYVFALLLAAAGLILQRTKRVLKKSDAAIHTTMNKAVDDELDEWFNDDISTDNAESKNV